MAYFPDTYCCSIRFCPTFHLLLNFVSVWFIMAKVFFGGNIYLFTVIFGTAKDIAWFIMAKVFFGGNIYLFTVIFGTAKDIILNNDKYTI